MMASLPLHVITLAVLALCYPGFASAGAFHQVLARSNADASFPEPLIFHNLTMEAFIAKLSEYRGSWANKRTTSNSAEDSEYHSTTPGAQVGSVPLGKQASSFISKREAIGGESKNNADQQAIVEDLSTACVASFPTEGLRFVHGRCAGDRLDWWCERLPGERYHRRHKRRGCVSTPKEPKRCAFTKVYNFKGSFVGAPYCADVIPIDEKTQEVDVVPTYEGYKTLPSEVWSPGTIDSFFQMAGEFSGLTGNFQYYGHYSSGEGFHSQSPKQAHSWACLGCPSGTLYIETVGFKSEAIGMTYPAGSFY